MNFTDIGFRGQSVCIPPSHRLNTDTQTFMLGSSYGNPQLVEEIFDYCEKEFIFSDQDLDSTSKFQKMTCLDSIGNHIYITMLSLNEFIYSNYNKESYNEGLEFVLLHKRNSYVYWAQVGWPFVLIQSPQKIAHIDGSFGIRSYPYSKDVVSNLPHTLLGLESSLNFKVEKSILTKSENLIFVKSSLLPQEIYTHPQASNEEFIKALYTNNSSSGAWLGRLNFS